MATERKAIKTIILGAEKTGKSALVKRYIHSVFTEDYNPTFTGADTRQVSVDGHQYTLELIAAEPAGENILSQTGDAFILLYAINSRKSFQHLGQLHNQIRTAKGSLARVPIFLVGSKADLESERQVQLEEGRQLAIELKCQKLFEVSAKHHVAEINDMFEKLVREMLRMEASDQTQSVVSPVTSPLPTTTRSPMTPTSNPPSQDPTSPLSESSRRNSNVFERLKFGSLKRKTSFHSLTRRKSGSFGESILSFGSGSQSRDVRTSSYGNVLNGGGYGAIPVSNVSSSPYRLDVDTSSWREAIKWPTEIIPEEDLKAK